MLPHTTPPGDAGSAAAPWHGRAEELARWAMARLVNRRDRCGGYWASDEGTQPFTNPAKGPRNGFVSHRLLVRHFRAKQTGDVIGAHALGADSRGLWSGGDIDAHPGTKADPGNNRRLALRMYAEAAGLGFRPLLYASNGTGGYHLRVLFTEPLPGEVLVAFGKWLMRDYRQYGFDRQPEVFPRQARLDETTVWGNWLRLVGRHHTRDYWPEVFDGTAWLTGAAAVEHVLSLGGDDPGLIPAEAREYRPPDEKPTRNGRVAPGSRTTDGGDDVFAAFNRAQTVESVAALLRRHGWTDAGRRGGRWDFYRPDKAGGSPSGNLAVIDGAVIFYGFTTSTDLPDRTGLNPAQLRAELEYGGHGTAHMAKLARALAAEGYGPPEVRVTMSANGRVVGSTTGKAAPPPPAGDAPAAPTGPRTGAQIILDYFRARYRPEFRRGSAVYCADGREVFMGEACAVPDSPLIERLADAEDAPRYKGGGLNRGGLPAFFKTWGKVAWGDLLASLPDEDGADLGPDGAAPEEFRRLVRAAMLGEVVLAEPIVGGGPTVIQRRPLIEWCKLFAKTGPWRDVRARRCWCKLREDEGGELKLSVAVRVELFAQMRADRRLCEMTTNTFTRRAERYGVGSSSRSDRPHGRAAVVLSQGFVDDLLAGLPDDAFLAGPEPGEQRPPAGQESDPADSP